MNRFNVRVYGIWQKKHKVLVSQEKVQEQPITKFPGGGLEYGEGIKDCLIREWQEELSISIRVKEHFYTTDYFVKSAWNDSQIISVYYIVAPLENLITWNNGKEYFEWVFINKELPQKLSLPIDKKVAKLLLRE